MPHAQAASIHADTAALCGVHAVAGGWQVDTILRFLGAPDLPSEVDVEVVLQDQLTGIVLVDPVTLGK